MTIPKDKNGCCVECGEDDIRPHGPNCSAWRAVGSPPKRESCGNILRAFHGNDYACDRERAHDGDHSHGSSYSMIGWTEPMGNPIVTRVPAPPITITPRYACGNEARLGDVVTVDFVPGKPGQFTVDRIDGDDDTIRVNGALWNYASFFTLVSRLDPSALSALGPALAAVSVAEHAWDARFPTVAPRDASPLARELIEKNNALRPAPALPPDYAATYRGFDERVRKIVTEMAPRAKVVTDWSGRGALTAWVDFPCGLKRTYMRIIPHSGVIPHDWDKTLDMSFGGFITESLLEIGRRGTR